MYDEILALTKKLVSIGSVNTTSGEKEIALYIEEYLRSIPYFAKHPEQIYIQPLKEDKLDRRNVIALIKGEKEESTDTILFHGHTDTVGIDDFGALKEYAFSTDKLMEKLKDMDLDEDVRKDLESGNYLFGRGACDMKSGDAVFLVIARKICENVKNLKGNILLSFNPVEENLHTGIIEARKIFDVLKEQENLNFLFAINNDYTCPLFPGDNNKYIYTGAVGKLLPCFYVQGKETHVGQCFEGFDASMIAAEIVRLMNLNPEFCDSYKGESTLPPSVLKMKDLKEQYNVQTSFSSFVYFNYFLHNASVDEIVDKLTNVSKEAFKNVLQIMNERYEKFCKNTGTTYSKLNYETQVLTYFEIFKQVEEGYDGNLKEFIQSEAVRYSQEILDKREVSLKLVQTLCRLGNIRKPTIVVFFAAPYCPHNTLKNEIAEEENLFQELENLIDKFEKELGEDYEILQFFPSLTDSSYLKIDDDYESIDLLKNNFPEYTTLYNVPLEKIKALNIPGINYGCYGKDAHKWTERVDMNYSFRILPKLILSTVEYFLK